MVSFLPFLTSIFPVFAFIAIGVFLRKLDFLPNTGWDAIERLVYYVLFPALLIHSIATVDSNLSAFLPMISTLNIAVLMMFFLSFIAWKEPKMNGPRFTSILQNNIRFNSFVPITLLAHYTDGGFLPLIALGIGMLIPTVNILSVWSLLVWGKASQNESPVSSLFKNPLIIACVIGFALHFFDIGLNEHITMPIHMLGNASMPLGLMAVGAAIDFERMKQSSSTRLFWTTFRALMFPLCVLISAYIFGIRDEKILLVSLVIAAAPTATNSYILSRQMGGDATYMASLIGTSTIISVFTMPLIIFLFFEFGIANVFK